MSIQGVRISIQGVLGKSFPHTTHLAPHTHSTQMDVFTREQVQKSMMLERFGEENPGFDFSGAEFSGSCPDPRNFMGGVKHQR